MVAAMTTTPKRINIIETSLDSLLGQTWKLDVVYLFIPFVFKRDGTVYQIPQWLAKKQGVQIVRCEDSGPSTHMLEVLRKERDPHTFILQVDDDQLYGKDLLASLLRGNGPSPGRAIGAATQHAHTHLQGIVLEGVHGVLFQRKHFDPTVFDHSKFCRECWLHDDLWLSAHLAKRAIGREQLFSRFETRALKYGFGDDALYRGGAGSDNARNFYLCIADLLRRTPSLLEAETRVAVVAPFFSRDEVPDGTSQTDILAGLRRFRTVQRKRGVGPHAFYPYGVQPSLLRSAAPGKEDSIIWAAGFVEHVGTWDAPIDIVVDDGAECSDSASCRGIQSGLLSALRFEEDPATLLVLFEETLRPQTLHLIIEGHLVCHRARDPKSREPCHGPRGSLSMWRHAAYEADRVQGAIFLPSFSSTFHAESIQGSLMASGEALWRDDLGGWRRQAKDDDLQLVQHATAGTAGSNVEHLMNEFAALGRRVVVVLSTFSSRLAHIRIVVRSLGKSGVPLRRIYVLVQANRKISVCGPGNLRSYRGVVVICSKWESEAKKMATTLAFETKPNTLIFLADDAHHYGASALSHLVIAADVAPGQVIGALGYTFGLHGGPIPIVGAGVILYRSFLDTRLVDLQSGPCKTEFEMSLAAHLVLKGVRVKVLGSAFGTQRIRRKLSPWRARTHQLTACRDHLVEKHPLIWASLHRQRCVVFVSLFGDTDDFLLEMTLRFAASQTRKPDEVVLIAMNNNILHTPVKSDRIMATSEFRASGRVGTGRGAVIAQDGSDLELQLSVWASSLRDKAGGVMRMDTEYGEPRSFVLSIASVGPCPESRCRAADSLLAAFDREIHPDTALFFSSAERLVNERVVDENLACLSACRPKCSKDSWCGQSETRPDGAIYDMTVRRVAGYKELIVG